MVNNMESAQQLYDGGNRSKNNAPKWTNEIALSIIYHNTNPFCSMENKKKKSTANKSGVCAKRIYFCCCTRTRWVIRNLQWLNFLGFSVCIVFCVFARASNYTRIRTARMNTKQKSTVWWMRVCAQRARNCMKVFILSRFWRALCNRCLVFFMAMIITFD